MYGALLETALIFVYTRAERKEHGRAARFRATGKCIVKVAASRITRIASEFVLDVDLRSAEKRSAANGVNFRRENFTRGRI